MVQRGKNVNVFLIDGRATGRIKCTLANWTGVAYKIPRTDIERSEDIELLNKSGVYFLFGTDDEDVSPSVYIGQARARKMVRGRYNVWVNIGEIEQKTIGLKPLSSRHATVKRH